MVRLILVLTVLLAPSAARADPLSTLLVSTLFGTGFASSTLGGILIAGITAGLGLGAQLLANLLFAKDKPQPKDVQGVVRQSVPPRWRHYGRRRIGGALMAIETVNGNLHQVIAFASHEVSALVEWIVDSRHVMLSDGATGSVTSDPYPAGKVWIDWRPGTASQTAYAGMISALPAVWTADHRGDGIASAHLQAWAVSDSDFSKTYPNRIPVLNGIFDAAKVYDPRSETTAFSANLALITRDYLTHRDGMQIDPAYIEDADFIAAAELADDLLATKDGGTVRRYHGALSYSFDTEPASVLARLMTACDGRLCLRPNGKVGFSIGVWAEPTVTLGDDDIIDFSLSDGAGPLREANEIIVKYEEALADYAAAQAQPWRAEDEISTYGEVRSRSIDAYEIQNHNHARRIGKIMLAKLSPRWQGQIRTTLAGMNAWDERWIRVQISDLDGEAPFDETMEVIDIGLDIDTMTVTMQVASIGAAAYDFDPETEEGTAPTLPDAVEEGAVPAPTISAVTGGQKLLANGITVAVINASWTASSRDDLRPEAQFSPADAETWSQAPVATGASAVEIVGLEDGSLYDFGVRWRANSGAVSPWALVENVAAVADPVAPDPVTGLDALPGLDPLVADVTWTNPNSGNFRAARVFRGTTATFGAATDVSGAIFGAPSTFVGHPDPTPSADTYYYWVRAENGSGVAAAPTGPVTVTTA